jgi:hypothetical protein
MLKYGDFLKISNGNSKTLIPRNIIPQNNISNNTVTNTASSASNTISSGSYIDSLNITDLNINTLSIITNTTNTNIIVKSPVTFDQDILINNSNFILNTETFTVNDNVILINSGLSSATINNNQLDNIISGFIFNIADQNVSTGYYGGLLYLPNSQISQVNINSSSYKWTNTKFAYFKDTNKGFFKLTYLPNTVNFEKYNNTLNENYTQFINNNTQLSNLLANSIGIYDGELVGLNNILIFNIIDTSNILNNIITLTPNTFNILNNIPIIFNTNLIFQDDTEDKFIILDSINNLITFNKKIYFNDSNLYFNNNLNFITLSQTILTINSSLIQFNIPTYISTLYTSNFELANINFVNKLNIVNTNNINFITFNSSLNTNTISILQTTYISGLIINNYIYFNNNIPLLFNNTLQFIDSNNYNYLTLNNNIVTINASNFIINNLITLNSITIPSTLTLQNSNLNKYVQFSSTYSTFYNTLTFDISSSPIILYNQNQTLQITNNNIALNLNNSVNISSEVINNQSSLLNISTKSFDYNYNNQLITFAPINKLYMVSGITYLNTTTAQTLTLTCTNIINNNMISGKIMGTTKSVNNTTINIYDINIWTYIDVNNKIQATYKSLSAYNSTNNGTWSISSINISNNNLNIVCLGNKIDNVVWSFKVDVLQI